MVGNDSDCNLIYEPIRQSEPRLSKFSVRDFDKRYSKLDKSFYFTSPSRRDSP
jgi:hypothetical protein